MKDFSAPPEPHASMSEAVHDTRDMMRSCVYSLDKMAEAFAITGNDKVATQLSQLAADLETQHKRLIEAYYKSVSDQLRETEQSTFNMVRGVLAGLEIGQKSSVEVRK